jgi:hypothetical protein
MLGTMKRTSAPSLEDCTLESIDVSDLEDAQLKLSVEGYHLTYRVLF